MQTGAVPPGAFFYKGRDGSARGPFLLSAIEKWHRAGMLSGSIRAHAQGESAFSSTVAELLDREAAKKRSVTAANEQAQPSNTSDAATPTRGRASGTGVVASTERPASATSRETSAAQSTGGVVPQFSLQALADGELRSGVESDTKDFTSKQHVPSSSMRKEEAESNFSVDPMLKIWLQQKQTERKLDALSRSSQSTQNDGDDGDLIDVDDQEVETQSVPHRILRTLARRALSLLGRARARVGLALIILAAMYVANSVVAKQCTAGSPSTLTSPTGRVAWVIFVTLTTLICLPRTAKRAFGLSLVATYSLLWHFQSAAPDFAAQSASLGAGASVFSAIQWAAGTCIRHLAKVSQDATTASVEAFPDASGPQVSGLLSLVGSCLQGVFNGVREPLGSFLSSFLSDLSAASLFVSVPMTSVLIMFLLVRSMFGRLLQVYGLGFTVIGCYAIVNGVMARVGVSDKIQNRVFSAMDAVFAPYMHGQILELRSVFVKFGQYLGARTDIVPPTWARVLGQLHDTVPACPPSYVKAVLEAEFLSNNAKDARDAPAPTKLEDIFRSIDLSAPLASASIAQVHSGVLMDGTRVAIKVSTIVSTMVSL